MRRTLVLLLTLVVLLGGASFALWSWTVARMQAGFDAWAAGAASQGWMVRTAAPQRAGWPFAAELVFADLSLSAGPDLLPGGAEWVAQQAVLHLSPLRPGAMELRLRGVQRVRAFGGPTLPFIADTLTVTLPLRGPDVVRIAGRRLRFDAPAEGLSIGRLEGALRPGATVRAALVAEAIGLPPTARQAALGARIATASLAATLEGTLPPPSPDVPARLLVWRRGGGMLRVTHLAVDWGPLGVTGTAALGLDPALQPQGTGTLRAVGYDAALTALAAGGAITPQAAQAVRAVLALLARVPEGGGAPEVDLPIVLDSGVLRVGRIPVGRLPHLDWSASP